VGGRTMSRLRFTVRELVLIVALASVGMGWYVDNRRQQRIFNQTLLDAQMVSEAELSRLQKELAATRLAFQRQRLSNQQHAKQSIGDNASR
jgi:hypothetical protein